MEKVEGQIAKRDSFLLFLKCKSVLSCLIFWIVPLLPHPTGISKCSLSLQLKVDLLVPDGAVYSLDKLFLWARALPIIFQLFCLHLYNIKIHQIHKISDEFYDILNLAHQNQKSKFSSDLF